MVVVVRVVDHVSRPGLQLEGQIGTDKTDKKSNIIFADSLPAVHIRGRVGISVGQRIAMQLVQDSIV